MAKGSDRLGSSRGIDETGDGLSGFLADEEELDRRALWRLGTWAVVAIGAVIVALVTNQSSIGLRHDQTAAADLLRQTQQVQLAAKETQSEARRLASAIETLNSDRDRLYSRVTVLEQGLDSVTGAIARQNSTPSASSAQASANSGTTSATAVNPATASPVAASTAPASAAGPVAAASPSKAAPTPPASAAPAATASVDPPPASPKPAPAIAPVAATTAAVADKPASAPAISEPGSPVASIPSQKPAQKPEAAQPFGLLMASKSMIGPPDPAASKLVEAKRIEAMTPPKTVTSAPMPEIAAVAPAAPQETRPDQASTPELVVKRTEFGVDVGGANSIPGLRALWRGLLKSRSNVALVALRPIIVIKENSNGLGMQLRLVAGPIRDAAAAAKICASLTVNDRSCTTAVFEGQRLALSADEQGKMDTSKLETGKTEANKTETGKIATDKAEADSKSSPASSKPSSHRHYYAAAKRPKLEEPPKPPEQPSTLSLIFGKH
jgi:hypothetical protein